MKDQRSELVHEDKPLSLSETEDLLASSVRFITTKIKRGVFTRKRLLVFFTLCSLVNYFDRGAIGGTLSVIEEDYNLSPTESGLLGGAFMIGFTVFCPLFAHLSHYYRTGTLMATGLGMWVAAAVFAAISAEMYSLAIARMLIGIGEASFAGLAPTYIDDIAPTPTRTTWLAIFYATIPIGAALGYGVAGPIAELWHWRLVFIIEAVLMLPCVGVSFVLPRSEWWRTSKLDAYESTDEGRGSDSSVVDTQAPTSTTSLIESSNSKGQVGTPTFKQSLAEVLSIPIFDTFVLASSSFMFVVGALSFWVPTYVVDYLGLKLSNATIAVGAVTVFTGLVGTALGGWIIDKLGGTKGDAGVKRVALVEFVSACVVLPVGMVGFMMDSFWLFIAFLFLGEMVLFGATAPLNATILSIVPLHQRSFAMSINIFAVHLLGDFPSPILVGVVSDVTGSRRAGMLFLIGWLVFAVLFFFISWVLAREKVRAKYEVL